ncbi:hypothetical protein EDB87DRAFT_1575827 [Lactarius vividus]|nr:hypothetical protein EDB87DRAFT_1575827 [Lactarius vividus]
MGKRVLLTDPLELTCDRCKIGNEGRHESAMKVLHGWAASQSRRLSSITAIPARQDVGMLHCMRRDERTSAVMASFHLISTIGRSPIKKQSHNVSKFGQGPPLVVLSPNRNVAVKYIPEVRSTGELGEEKTRRERASEEVPEREEPVVDEGKWRSAPGRLNDERAQETTPDFRDRWITVLYESDLLEVDPCASPRDPRFLQATRSIPEKESEATRTILSR